MTDWGEWEELDNSLLDRAIEVLCAITYAAHGSQVTMVHLELDDGSVVEYDRD